MKVGLCAGFGDHIAGSLPFIAETGIQVVRQEAHMEMDEVRISELVAEFVGQPVGLLMIVQAGKMCTRDNSRRAEPHEIAVLGRRVVRAAQACGLDEFMLEIGNEPDLAHIDYRSDPSAFAAAIQQTYETVRNEGFEGTVITGGISNLMLTPQRGVGPWKKQEKLKRGLDYLESALASGLIPEDAVIGVHRYSDGDDPKVPQVGFKSREAETDKLLKLIGGRRFAVTECGAHDFRQTEEQQAAAIRFELDYWSRHGAILTAVYQLNDEKVRAKYEACWGICKSDGNPKAAVDAIRKWQAERN